MSSDYFDYVERKTAPKPSYNRPMPKFDRQETKTGPMLVEEVDVSQSMIQRIFGKLKGE